MSSGITRRIVEEVTDLLTDTLSREDLRSLITDDGSWKAFVEAAELSSEQEDALHDALNEHLAQMPTDENDKLQKELKKKRFLEQFPELKRKLEEHIRKLRDLADHHDKVNKDLTISNVVSSSTSTASGILGIFGLFLAPITGGGSLLLTATSLGLGAAAAVTNLTTTIVEESHRVSDEAEAKKLIKASTDILHDILVIMPKITIKLCNTGEAIAETCKFIREYLRSFRTARGLGSAPQITRAARIRGLGFSSIMLGLDVYHLVTDSMSLHDGAKTELAQVLRDLAHKLEEKFWEFEKIYKALQSDLPQ